jgi:hypothetical protein
MLPIAYENVKNSVYNTESDHSIPDEGKFCQGMVLLPSSSVKTLIFETYMWILPSVRIWHDTCTWNNTSLRYFPSPWYTASLPKPNVPHL